MSYTNGLDKPTDYFNTVLWTGNATDNRSITGVNFQPDLVWYKERSSTSWHNLQDVIRGVGKQIHSNSTLAEATNNNTIKAFETDGFQIGTEADINQSSQTYVAWNWLADNTTGSSNTDGSITSSVSANTTAGFSIVSWTGTGTNPSTVGHGLGTAPSCIILKNRDTAGDWYVGHDGIGWTDRLKFTTASTASSSTLWNNTAPTSSVFTISSALNFNGDNTIAYCFAEKKGFSKFGSYTSNNNADGTFVYTGFKPSFIILKNTSTGGTNWHLYDNKRLGYNVDNNSLLPSSSNAESTADQIDILSNGFKIRYVGDNNNASDKIIYMAFAESPFVTSTGIPTTAR